MMCLLACISCGRICVCSPTNKSALKAMLTSLSVFANCYLTDEWNCILSHYRHGWNESHPLRVRIHGRHQSAYAHPRQTQSWSWCRGPPCPAPRCPSPNGHDACSREDSSSRYDGGFICRVALRLVFCCWHSDIWNGFICFQCLHESLGPVLKLPTFCPKRTHWHWTDIFMIAFHLWYVSFFVGIIWTVILLFAICGTAFSNVCPSPAPFPLYPIHKLLKPTRCLLRQCWEQ